MIMLEKKSVEYLVFTRLGFVVVSMFDLVDKKNYFLFFFLISEIFRLVSEYYITLPSQISCCWIL